MLAILIDHIVEILFAVLMMIANLGAYRLLGALNIDRESKLAQKVQDGLHYGLQFAESRLREKIDEKGFTLEIKNEYLREAANYLADSYPGAIKDLGLTGQHIADMLEARLNERMGETGKPAVKSD